MSIYKKTLAETLENKKLRLAGKHISIPFPFTRFNSLFPGIQKRRYYGITANSKVGKTKITDFLFVITPYLFSREQETNIKPKIKYFSLEMSKEDKIKEVRSFLLFYKYGITMSPDIIDSIYEGKILNDDIEKIIKGDEFLAWFEDFESVVEYLDHTKNPFGIYKEIRKYAHLNGYYINKSGNKMDMSFFQKMDKDDYKITQDDKSRLEILNKEINFYYPSNPDEYFIPVVDHARLLTIEKGFDERTNIENFSSNYLISCRDRWSFIPVLIQQQAAQQESVENMKANKLRPSPDGLGISKNTQQDFDVLLGLFSPARHNKKTWEEYDISKLQDKHRELEILLNRRGNSTITQLYFNGAANYFKELVEPDKMTETIYNNISQHLVKP